MRFLEPEALAVDPDELAAVEFCRILRSCPRESASECVQTLKHQLHFALRRAFYWEDCARQAEGLLALRDAPKSNDSQALRAMRRAMRILLERCALLQARCLQLLRDSQPEDTQPIVLPPAQTGRRAIQ